MQSSHKQAQHTFTQHLYQGYSGGGRGEGSERDRSNPYGNPHEVHSSERQHTSYQQPYPPLNEDGQHWYGPQQFPYMHPLENGRFAAACSYVLCWFSGLLFLLFGGQNRFIRFHALQSLLFFGGISIIDLALMELIGNRWLRLYWFPHTIMFFLLLAFFLINCIAFVGWLLGMVQAGSGKYYKLPLVGDIAMRYCPANAPLP